MGSRVHLPPSSLQLTHIQCSYIVFIQLLLRFYHKAVGAMIVFDVTVYKTFENVESWLKDLQDHAEPNTVIMLLGNKIDLRHLQTVSIEDAKLLAGELNVFWSKIL